MDAPHHCARPPLRQLQTIPDHRSRYRTHSSRGRYYARSRAAPMRIVLLLALACAAKAQMPCDRLASLTLSTATISAADLRAATQIVPAHCRIAATLRPSADSQI